MPAPLSPPRFSVGLCLQGWDREEIKANSWWVKPFCPSSSGEALTWGLIGDKGLYYGVCVVYIYFFQKQREENFSFSLSQNSYTKLDSLQKNNKNNYKNL